MNMQLFYKRIARYVFIFMAFFWVFALRAFSAQDQDLPKLIIFHSATCHKCTEVKQQIMPAIEKEFQNRVNFEYRDTSDIENYKMAIGLIKQSGQNIKFSVPLFYMEGRFLTANGQLKNNLNAFITNGLSRKKMGALAFTVDLVEYFRTFAPATIIIAGLEDGINPCAFTVIVFFISFLALQGYRKIELAIIGSSFILAVFLTYLGIGFGIFNFFYHLKGFWIISRILNLIIGVGSIIFGIFAIYDFIKYKQTGSTDKLVLQLPKVIKDRIHEVVGFFHRKSFEEKKSGSARSLSKLVASAFITGFLVSLLEAVCTGQVYLPTITYVLKTSTLKAQAIGYLLLYNAMFIAPLIVIFVLALFGTTSSQFSNFLKKHLGLIKIFMAALFFSLGIFLIWKA